jgi:hypothetical protein
MKRKSVISLILRVGAKPLENGFIPPLDGSDGDVGVRVPEFYMCVKDTGTKYQLWISDFNIDGTFTRVHPFIISHTKTMTRTREDGKEEVFSACIKPDDTRYLGGNKSSSVVATKLQGRPRTGISYDKANEFCANRGDWITMIDYLEYCALQALCYIEYANFDNQAALNTNLTSDGFKQGGLGGCAFNGSLAGSGSFDSHCVRSDSSTGVGFFTTIKLD